MEAPWTLFETNRCHRTLAQLVDNWCKKQQKWWWLSATM